MSVTPPMGDHVKSTSDFSGAAKLYLTKVNLAALKDLNDSGLYTPTYIDDAITSDSIQIDMLVTSVAEEIIDYAEINTYLGSRYSAHFYGKAPIVLQLNMELIDSYDSNVTAVTGTTKGVFMWLYSNLFSLTGVAKYEITPCLQILDTTYYGAFVSVNLTEESNASNIIHVAAQFLVFNRISTNLSNASGIHRSEILYDKSTYPEIREIIASIEKSLPAQVARATATKAYQEELHASLDKIKSVYGSTILRKSLDYPGIQKRIATQDSTVFDDISKNAYIEYNKAEPDEYYDPDSYLREDDLSLFVQQQRIADAKYTAALEDKNTKTLISTLATSGATMSSDYLKMLHTPDVVTVLPSTITPPVRLPEVNFYARPGSLLDKN